MYFKTTMGKKTIKLMLAGSLENLSYKSKESSKAEILYDKDEVLNQITSDDELNSLKFARWLKH